MKGVAVSTSTSCELDVVPPAVASSVAEVARGYLQAHPGVAPFGVEVEVDTPYGWDCVLVGDPEELSGVFLNGQCHALALALFEATGAELVGVGHERCALGCCDPGLGLCAHQLWHVAVRVGGVFVDGEGVHSSAATLGWTDADVTPHVLELTPEVLYNVLWLDTDWARPNLPLARAFVPAAVSNLPALG